MSITRKAAVVICGGALLAASAPTVASGVQKATEVFIANGDDRPVPTKAVGTTSVSGSVSVPGGVAVTNKPDVAVPDGVTVNGKPSVSVPDGVSINGPVAVSQAAPERFSVATGAFHTGGDELCNKLEVPEGKRLVLDVVHFALNSGSLTNTYLRQVTDVGTSGFVLDRFRPTPTAGPNARLEGPFIDDSKSTLAVCARDLTTVRAVAVGTLEDE